MSQRMYIVAIYDVKAEVYLNPFAARALGEAQRMFQDAINNKNADNPLSVHPEDFDLYEVGTFATDSGLLVGIVDEKANFIMPRLLVRGSAFVNK